QDRPERGEGGERIGATEGPERIRPAVEAELPRGGVAARRDQVMPVLGDEPDTGESRECPREVVLDAAEEGACRKREQDRGAEVPLVEAKSGQVQTGTERVPLDADESSVAPGQIAFHSDLIGRTGRRA